MKNIKKIYESDRHIGDDPFEFLLNVKNIIPNGSFVSVGYLNDKIISSNEDAKFRWGPTTKKPITPKNDAELTEYINKIPDSKFKEALINFQNSPKYQAALANGKKAPFNIDGDVHIIKISRFIFNWKNNEAFAKFYGKRSDAVARVRALHGFGFPEDTYPEDDWRLKPKYKGTGIRPVSGAKGNQGNPYKPLPGNSGFYSHIDEPGKISIRQIYNPKASKTSLWFFIDADGNIVELERELIAWLMYAYKSSRVINKIDEIKEEEQAFLDDIAAIKDIDSSERTLILDDVIYITGTTVDEQGNKDPFTWDNNKMIMKRYKYINDAAIEHIIDRCKKKSKKEEQEMNNTVI